MKKGIVYTPIKIVKYMLDKFNYYGEEILGKHIIDNSCGEGIFLTEVVTRYIKAYKTKNKKTKGLEAELQKYIHGIEINKEGCEKTIDNLNLIISKYNLGHVNWDILNSDTTIVNKFNKKMDFVVGNPPYIRVHHMENIKNNFLFSKNGMTDLYLIFFEIGLEMLNKNGKLMYISPNSFFNSGAGDYFRKYLVQNNLIKLIINLGHYNPFKNATTYTAITFLDKNKKSEKSLYFNYNGTKDYGRLSFDSYEYYTNNIFYFNTLKMIRMYKNIFNSVASIKKISVKNGLATNLDKFFINNDWSGEFVKKIYKISTGNFSKIFFPYEKDGKVIEYNRISKDILHKLKQNKNDLENRDLRGNRWYEFARTQGIKDTFKDKLCVNSLLKDAKSIKIKHIGKGIPVYSGYYIDYKNQDSEKIKEIILKENFFEYVKSLNKQKNGGYFTFSSKDLENYLNYNL